MSLPFHDSSSFRPNRYCDYNNYSPSHTFDVECAKPRLSKENRCCCFLHSLVGLSRPNYLSSSVALRKFCSGIHSASSKGCPSQITRYSQLCLVLLITPRCFRILSTSYPDCYAVLRILLHVRSQGGARMIRWRQKKFVKNYIIITTANIQ